MTLEDLKSPYIKAATRAVHLMATMEAKHYKVFIKGDYNVNIVGVRSYDRECDTFNDALFCFYSVGKYMYFHSWSITTDPGLYWLMNPSKVTGTAILVPGQYRGVYRIDKHRGKYYALCQRYGAVKVFRDANKDIIIDRLPDSTEEGLFGINIHKAGWFSRWVGKWSAGCQVFQRSRDFNKFMKICKEAEFEWGNKFTYTLLEEEDLKIA